MTIGVTIGKFNPLHTGHELMIEFGSRMLDHLYVIVSDRCQGVGGVPPFVGQRYDWVTDFAAKNNLKNVTVLFHWDASPEPKEIDEYGTVLDTEFQNYWVNTFTELVPTATHFVSSDHYGKTMATLLGINWLPVDPDRETISISGTKIRQNILGNFKYISDSAKSHYIKKVAIIGPESVGKSTMVSKVSDYFGCIGVHEYGRTVSEAKNNILTKEDFMGISDDQRSLIDIAVKKTKVPLIISDTEDYTTFLFGDIYLDECISQIYDRAKTQDFDLYIILAPTVPWVDDGLRVIPDQQQREMFFERLVAFCEVAHKQYVVIAEDNFIERTQKVIFEVEKLLRRKEIA